MYFSSKKYVKLLYNSKLRIILFQLEIASQGQGNRHMLAIKSFAVDFLFAEMSPHFDSQASVSGIL